MWRNTELKPFPLQSMSDRKLPFYESRSSSGERISSLDPEALSWGKETIPAVSRLTQYQAWNDASEEPRHDRQSNFFLPSEFESLTIDEERASSSFNPSRLAMAATRCVPSTIGVGKAHSSKSFSSTGSSITNSPTSAARRKSSLSSAQNNTTATTMKIDSVPPGFHSPISISNSNQGRGKKGFHSHHRGNMSYENSSNRGGNGDFRMKTKSWQHNDGQRSQRGGNCRDGAPDMKPIHLLQSYQSHSSASCSIGNDWNRHVDDTSYKSQLSNAKSDISGDSTSSLFRHGQTGLHTSDIASNGAIGRSNYTRDSYTENGSQSSTAIQKMLASSLMSKEAAQRQPAHLLPSLVASSFSELDEQRSLPKKLDSSSLSFALPPHLPVLKEPTDGIDINEADKCFLDYDDGDMSRTSRSTSASHRPKGKNKDWRLKMNQILYETPVGEVDQNEIPTGVLMNVSAEVSFYIE